MAVLFTVIVIVFGVTTRDTLGLKFFIYMTNQGFMLLTLNFVLVVNFPAPSNEYKGSMEDVV